MIDNDKKTGVTMVDRAMQILNYLCEKDGSAGVSEIAKALSLPKANVYRILNTLCEWRAVECSSVNEGYRLGLMMVKLGERAGNDINLIGISKPVMKKMAQETGESVNLGVLCENSIWSIYSVGGQSSVIFSKQIPISPLYCSSMGKSHLAYFSDSELKCYFETTKIVSNTEKTITTLEDFFPEREKILAESIAYDNEEYEMGLSCIATPIFKGNKKVVASIGISGPTSRINAKRELLVSCLKETATYLSRYTDYIDIECI